MTVNIIIFGDIYLYLLLRCDGSEGTSINLPCLTFVKHRDTLDIKCHVKMLDSKITFVDPRDKEVAFCKPPSNTSSCKTNVQAGRIFQDLAKNTTVFRLSKLNFHSVDGIWKCIHGNDRKEMLMKLSAGFMNYVTLKLTADLVEIIHDHQKKVLLNTKCETCWTPVGNTAVFYINSMSKDEVKRFKDKCYHKGEECRAETCGCSVLRHEYTWKLYIGALIKGTNISCSMRFEYKKTHFIKEATLQYDGKGFTNHKEKINIVKNGTKEMNVTTAVKDNSDKTDDDSRSLNTKVGIVSTAVVIIGSLVIALVCYKKHCQCCSKFQELPTKEKPYHQNLNEVEEKTSNDKVTLCNTIDDTKDDEKTKRIAVTKSCPRIRKNEVSQNTNSPTTGYNICEGCFKPTPKECCSGCNTFFCEICTIHHRDCNHLKPLASRQPKLSRSFSSYDGPRLTLQFKRTFQVDSTVRIRGVAILPEDRIVIADYANCQLLVFNKNGNVDFQTHLGKEPRGLVKISENDIAVTFAYEKEIVLYTINSDNAVNNLIFDLMEIGKPFSIAYHDNHFLVEIGEREDGKFVILNRNAVEIVVIPNKKYAYFTGNSIDVGLNMQHEEVFVSSIDNKAVYCISFNGEIKWMASVPSPQGLTVIPNSSSESRNILVTNKYGKTLYELCSSESDGQTNIMDLKDDIVLRGRYITSTTIGNRTFVCVEVEQRNLKIYEITENTEQ